MSGLISGLVWNMAIPVNQKYVLLAYADHADHEGYNVRPSYDLVAWKTGYTKQHVMKIVAQLELAGIMVVDKRGGNKEAGTLGRPTEWHIDIDAAPKSEKRVRGVSPTIPQGIPHDTPMRVSPTIPKTSVEPPLETSINTIAANAAADGVDLDFDHYLATHASSGNEDSPKKKPTKKKVAAPPSNDSTNGPRPPQAHMLPIAHFLLGAVGGQLGRPLPTDGLSLGKFARWSTDHLNTLKARYAAETNMGEPIGDHFDRWLERALERYQNAGALYAAYCETEKPVRTWTVGETTVAISYCLALVDKHITPISLQSFIANERRSEWRQNNNFPVSLKTIAERIQSPSAGNNNPPAGLVPHPEFAGVQITPAQLVQYLALKEMESK